MASSSNVTQDTSTVGTLSDETKIFIMGLVNNLIMTARKLRLEAVEAPTISGELGDRAAEILCVVCNLLTMLAQATRVEVEILEEEFEAMGIDFWDSEDSGTISPFELERCIEGEE